MLFCFFAFFFKTRIYRRTEGKRTNFARIRPFFVHRSNETRFCSPLPSCMIHTSALMGPLVVWMEIFLEFLSETMLGRDGGGRERSRTYSPSTPVFSLDMRR
jgi:hypothetical protein